MSRSSGALLSGLVLSGAIPAFAAAPDEVPAAMTPAAAPEVELLHNTKSLVLVSSLVSNKKIKPEHLVDGKLDTACNSRTDKLDETAIEFLVPETAQVSALRMTAGSLGPVLGAVLPLDRRLAAAVCRDNAVEKASPLLGKSISPIGEAGKWPRNPDPPTRERGCGP